jgi:methionyl-tRNA formyltransferase
MADRTYVLATPHARHDALEQTLGRLEGTRWHRVKAPADLAPEWLMREAPRYVFFAHWSWKIPRAVYEAHECVIFHMTDVPFGRGGSPLQNLISRGIYETKLSALRCVEEMDAGPVYLKERLSLHGSAEEIFLRAGDVIGRMIQTIIREEPKPCAQVGEPVVFKRRSPSDGDISGLDDLSKVFDWIRMLDADGYPPAFLETGHLRLEFSRASLRRDGVVASVRIRRKAP